jgi:superfamily II DNA/RNA helicase
MKLSASRLSLPLLRAAAALGYDEATPVQAAAIPAILDGRDVWASAKTGSGKTAAFVLPILDILSASRRERGQIVRAVVLVPTRELAMQIGGVIDAFARDLPVRIDTRVAVGGVSINPQMMALRGGADVLVATPGRLLDLVDHNAVRLSSLEVFVLDEADRLLSLGFADELARIVALLPRTQSLLFSATFPPAVRTLAEELLDDPVRIDVDAGAMPDEASIVQRAIEVDTSRRTMLLRELLKTEGWSQVLVFVASRYAAEHVTDKLQRAGVAAAALHGDLAQGARTKALADLKAGRVRVLVATDVAARGIDVAQLPAVDYVHRIGRTGRAGETGTAVSFVTAEMAAHFSLIEKRHGLHVARERIAGFEPTEVAAVVRDPSGGVKGRRKSKKDKLREAAARAGSEATERETTAKKP